MEMKRRNITHREITQVLAAPEARQRLRAGRVVYQSRVDYGRPTKTYLLRVFVDIDRHPPEVVTAYRTSKLEKYSGVSNDEGHL